MVKNMNKSHTIAASDARNNFSDLISKVQYQGNVYLIERYGEVVAKLVPATYQEEVVSEKLADQEEPKREIGEPDTARTQTPLASTNVESFSESQTPTSESATSATTSAWSSAGSYRQVTPMGRTVGVGAMTTERSFSSSMSDFDTNKDNDVMSNKQDSAGSDFDDDQSFSPFSTTAWQSQTQEELPAQPTSSTDTPKEAESGWSALKKLEELIAAQKRKNEQVVQETQNYPPTQEALTNQEFSDQKQNSTVWDQPVAEPTTGSATGGTSDQTTPDYSSWPSRPPFFQRDNKNEETADWFKPSTQPDQPEKVDVIRKRIDL